jgi:hypothetical protein
LVTILVARSSAAAAAAAAAAVAAAVMAAVAVLIASIQGRRQQNSKVVQPRNWLFPENLQKLSACSRAAMHFFHTGISSRQLAVDVIQYSAAFSRNESSKIVETNNWSSAVVIEN